MKKGFTLIELLAVILILGIIALIAIPTVNNIISEARYGAFKSGNENIMKSIEQDCQTTLIKGAPLTLSYKFEEGKSNHEINIKGNLPNDGYILLNNECTITDYYLTDKNNVHSNTDDIRKNNMIMLREGKKSIFMDLYSSYFDKIISIKFLNNLSIPNDAIEIKDISISQNGKIKSWLIKNEQYYDLYIGSESVIYANPDSSYLFNDMILVENISFDNFNTSFVFDMGYMFNNCNALKNLNLSTFITDNVKTMIAMFYKCTNLVDINILNWNTFKLQNMTYMFAHCYKLSNIIGINNLKTENVTSMHQLFILNTSLTSIDLSNWDTSNVTDMHGVFQYCRSLKNIYGLEKWNTSKVENIKHLFNECISLKSINLSGWDLSNVKLIENAFYLSEVEELKFNNSDSVNLIIGELPKKNINMPGKIMIVGDKTNLDINSLTSKNWIVI